MPFNQFDVSVAAVPPPSWPSVTACMIVKDEAANLGPCLDSLEDLASQIVVVDTGSTDETVAIARARGAEVYPFVWVDDFAAARNESLRHATGEWILWLDADNRLTPKAVAQIKCAIEAGHADACGCRVSSSLADGSRSHTEYLLLFRNGLGVQFTGAIHESPMPALVRLRLRLAHTDIVVEHTGYQTPELSRRKSERNLAILELELARRPQDLDLLFYRGQSRFHLDDIEGSQSDLRRFLALTAPSATFHWKRFTSYTMLSILREKQGDLAGMEPLLGVALQEFPAHPAFLAALGRLHLALGQPEKALPELQAAHGALATPQLGTVPPRAAVERSLAECRALLSQGDPMAAVEACSAAIRIAPSDADNYRHLALALQRLGQEEEALQVWRYAAGLAPAATSGGQG